jgi:hypothetical protein
MVLKGGFRPRVRIFQRAGTYRHTVPSVPTIQRSMRASNFGGAGEVLTSAHSVYKMFISAFLRAIRMRGEYYLALPRNIFSQLNA